MLLASKYPNKMEDKFPNLKVKINQNKNELIYEGIQPDIQAAKVNMYEHANQFGMRVRENIPQNCIDLFNSKQVKDYIVKKLKSQRLVGVWEAVDNKLAVCSYETDLSNCVEFISKSVQERTLQVHRESSSVLTSQQWQDRIAEIHNKNSGQCKISCKEDFSQVYVTTTDDLVDELYGTVAQILKQHAIFCETFSLGNKSIVRLIQNHHMDKLTEISKDLTTHYIQIHCDSKGISVQGTEEGITIAKEKMSRFAEQLQKKEHTIKRPGLASHMASDKGQDNVKSVESAHPVVIKIGGNGDEDIDFRTVTSEKLSQGPDVGAKVHACGDAYDDRRVYTAEGDMSLVRTDVLVHSADSYICMSGGLGKVLATKGAFGEKPSGSGGDSLTSRQTRQHADPNKVDFIFYSLSMSQMNSAITRLEKMIVSDFLNIILKDSVIKQLTGDQIRGLRAMATEKQIELDVQPGQKTLKMAGISKNVLEFTDNVQRFLRDIERFEMEKNQAEMMKNMVQWYFIEITEIGQNLEKYTPHINLKIEKAFKEQTPSIQFKDADGNTYEIDFGKLEEYPLDNPNDTVKVVRRDLIKESAVDTPATWTAMGKAENLKVVTLQTTDQEYQDVAQQFNTSCGWAFTITKIDRIQNMTLFQQYQAKKKLLTLQNKQGTQNERILWQGTAPEAVDSINAHGFNRSFCSKNAVVFGEGVYFAVGANYSAQNTYSRPDPNGIKRMYLSKVLTGEFCMGKSGMRVPPPKSGGAAHALYDSVVNNVAGPSMFIIFNDTQAYPDYLVAFK